ncbi:TSUP family transporter [Porticoccaceae bacterium]|nr:TSUP family transporter [Porticoccaceae bacterium]
MIAELLQQPLATLQAFASWQLAAMAVIFVWSGFVRSGLGFGGSLFTLPLLLLVHNDPLFFLPIISQHLLFFAALTVTQSQLKQRRAAQQSDESMNTVHWKFIGIALAIMLLPKLAGVIGLIILPTEVMNVVIFTLISVYAITYIIDRPFTSSSRFIDLILLALGAYISGISLIGGPLIIAVALRYIAPVQFRDTLFVIWFVLVSIKMGAFYLAGVDLQWQISTLLLPIAAVGHVIGLRFHDRLVKNENRAFFKVIGWALLFISSIGVGRALITLL